jgi:hypothetical protein
MPTAQSRRVVKNALVAWAALGVVVVWNFLGESLNWKSMCQHIVVSSLVFDLF